MSHTNALPRCFHTRKGEDRDRLNEQEEELNSCQHLERPSPIFMFHLEAEGEKGTRRGTWGWGARAGTRGKGWKVSLSADEEPREFQHFFTSKAYTDS